MASALRAACSQQMVPIQVVVDCRNGSCGIDDTLRSLASAGSDLKPILISGPKLAGTISISEPRELVNVTDGIDIWLCTLSPGDRLARGACSIYAAAAAKAGDTRLIYADDDLIWPRKAPHFKPDWNPELIEHHDFITDAAILHVSRGALSCLPAAGWQQALVRQAAQCGGVPTHLPLILHHRRERPGPVVPDKPVANLHGPAPLVTVIVPTRNQAELLGHCIGGLRQTNYSRLEMIVVDNGSDDPETLGLLHQLELDGVQILRLPGPFNFSALNNTAAAKARGEVLCFLNNDTQPLDADWLRLMVLHAVRPDIGAVGALMLYPDRTIQHAGVHIGLGGGAGHAHRFQKPDEDGYFLRPWLPQRVSAVTAACMVVEREKFLSAGGFDEHNFPVAFNDVDLCLKLNQRGWQSFYEPRAVLIHHESQSRGLDRSPEDQARFSTELGALKHKWRTNEYRDPYHHPHLSRYCEQFVIAP